MQGNSCCDCGKEIEGKGHTCISCGGDLCDICAEMCDICLGYLCDACRVTHTD
ncbi:MAG TPA: hypothetical protein VGB37_01175 [Candidatus Lokiarchaeia archaeon]